MLRVFRSKPKYVTVRPKAEQPVRKEVPDNLWVQCERCQAMIYRKELDKTMHVCGKCGYHFRISVHQRTAHLVDPDTFQPLQPLQAGNPLGFPNYEEKLQQARERTGLDDAIKIGTARIDGIPLVLALIDFGFIGGSMGSVVGEQLTRGFDLACSRELPIVVFSGGGGGARMHEGIFSLMQMAKTSQAVGRFRRCGQLYLSVLTHPTMGGIYASFASLGDIIMAEPGALIGFAGPRIVAETTRQKLPEDFQTAEFALEHGMLDAIVPRAEMRSTVAMLLSYHV